MTGLLKGRVVLVTGAGGGLGLAYALACAREGATLVVNDIDAAAVERTAEKVRELGGRAEPVAGSVGDWSVAERTSRRALDAFGRLDGCVANAGVKHEALPWEEREADLRRIVEVNVLGVMFTARHAMAAMARTGGGSLVTVVSGARFGIPGQSAYGATKGAVAAMTAAWALEGRAANIRVNAVSPLAETPMAAADVRADRPRLGDPDEVAPLIVALLSDSAGEVTGETFRYDGRLLSRYDQPGLRAVDAAALGLGAGAGQRGERPLGSV